MAEPELGAFRPYERKITPVERFFSHSPFSTVTVVARIRGPVSESLLRNAVSRVQARHPVLRARIVQDEAHAPWLTTDGAEEIPVEVVARESAESWIGVVAESSRIPFDFNRRPAIRFILVQSPDESDLILFCHHIICDGLSLAYLARDMMHHLGDPARQAEVLPDPVPISLDHMPPDVSLNAIARFFLGRVNKRWEREKISFDMQDYLALHEAYGSRYSHQVLTAELSEGQTTALVERCRREGVTVNSALAAAFVGAQLAVRGDEGFHPNMGVAGSLRDRLPVPPGQAMGFYAGVVTLKHRYQQKLGFWENARRFHRKVRPRFTNQNLFEDLLAWCYLDPAILEAINFKKLGGLVPPHASRHQKIASFSQRDDVVLSILKRDKMETPDRVFMGTAVTNLTRLDFPRSYGPLELDRLILKPGGGFPLASVNLVLGAVTCAGKLSLLIEYVEESIPAATMAEIKEAAMGYLLGE